MMATLLEMRGIVKHYPGVLALDHVDFSLNSGEIHSLVGENGAGKSTLVKILSGSLQRDAGSVLVDGKEVSLTDPWESIHHGIGIIYQESTLVPQLTVAANIVLGNEPVSRSRFFLDRSATREIAAAALRQLGETIDLSATAEDLSVGQQQVIEIAKAISRRVRILAMDEPTAALTGKEAERLFTIIRRLKDEGVGVIYISHRLDEIFEIANRVTVLRDGKKVSTTDVSELDRRTLVDMMVGRSIEDEYPQISSRSTGEILRLEHLQNRWLRDISLTVEHGEVLGVAGLIGAGRSRLARAIFGADAIDRGAVFLDGASVSLPSPRDAIDAGISLLTEDRNRLGLMMQMKTRENISISALDTMLRWPFVNRKKERAVARKLSDQLRIVPHDIESAVMHLSGGNRQKVVLARWLATRSKLLIFDEPTAGVDVGVKHEIYLLIRELAAEGKGLMVISSDLPELLGISDRVAVMCEGRLAGILSRDEVTQEKVMTLATGGS